MKGLFIRGLQGVFNKLVIMLIFLICPSLNFSQVYQIDNDEVTTRVILDNEYLVLSNLNLNPEILSPLWEVIINLENF